MRSNILLTGLLPLLQFSRAQNVVQNSTSQACLELSQQFPNQTSLPGQNEYQTEYLENWSQTCVQQPYCVFTPTNANQVAAAVKIMVQMNTSFAVRGGGHMQVPGSSSITNGVLISADGLNQLVFLNDEKTAASLGPGNGWIDVYSWIAPYNRAIIGGRYQPVGVPGLLLGGGINYFGSQVGWAANSVINFQVVLANSSIVNANATHNPDLWWALKGGSNNFGIVTRFDVETYPLDQVMGGTATYEPSSLDDFLYAVSNYSAPGGGSSDVRGSVNPSVEWNFTTGNYQLVTIITLNATTNDTSSFTNFTALPQITNDFADDSNLVELTKDTALTGLRNQRALYFAKGIQATAEAVEIANHTYFELIEASPEIQAARGMLVAGTYQTISQSWLEAAVAKGGDAIDLDPANGGFISFLGAMIWDDEADDELAYAFAYNMTDTIASRVEAAEQDYPFVYMNDATLNQPVFQFYGGGKSLPRLNAIAEAYDPNGVFQTLLPGGFKLSSVNQTRPVDLDKRIV